MYKQNEEIKRVPKKEGLPDEVFHFWIERRLNELYDPREHILCLYFSGKEIMGDTVNVTIAASKVTCKSCLEWLHA